MKFDIAVYLVLFLLATFLITFVWFQKTKTPQVTVTQITQKGFGTNTTLVDTLQNTWTFQMGRSGILEYTWTPLAGPPLTIWDSQYGVCNYPDNYASLTAAQDAGEVVYLETSATGGGSIVLAQTPMYIDDLGIQRTFQLKMYSGDVRIESTNGERAKNGGLLSSYPSFWSIWGQDITGLTDYQNKPSFWPLTFSDIIWQNIDNNFQFVGQFLASGDLITHATSNYNNFFQASTFVQPICSNIIR